MYLTRFEVNRARRDTRRLLSSLQSAHAAVLAGFPSHDRASDGRVLWRVDDTGKALLLYIVSPAPPDLTHLVEQIGWPTRPTWDSRDYAPLLNSLTPGQRWGFRLTANPTHIGRVSPSGVKRRFGHVTLDQQCRWLTERADRLGIRIAANSIGADDLVLSNRIMHRFQRQGSTVTLNAATFDGTLEVVEPNALRAALIGGIGRAKAYGCGLMTLAKA